MRRLAEVAPAGNSRKCASIDRLHDGAEYPDRFRAGHCRRQRRQRAAAGNHLSQGNLKISGGTSLVGHGFARSSRDGFGKAVSISVRLDAGGTLRVNSGDPMSLTLHHDVLFGSTPNPSPHLLTDESTSPGLAATIMVWAIPASSVR
jgi:hypothetical protein